MLDRDLLLELRHLKCICLDSYNTLHKNVARNTAASLELATKHKENSNTYQNLLYKVARAVGHPADGGFIAMIDRAITAWARGDVRSQVELFRRLTELCEFISIVDLEEKEETDVNCA